MDKSPNISSQDNEVRKGPWTMEEDLILINYIANHGEGVWNSLARSAGLKRTGKSCRLRWLNYLRPDVRRGNITAEEELLIMELHAKWGNRWSKIAKHLPGRTDNEIKNYWRTRIQKHLKQAESSTINSRHDMSPSDNHDQACVNQISISNPPNYVSSMSNHHHEAPYLPSIPSSSYPVDDQVMETSTSTYNIVLPNMHPTTTGEHFWPDASEEELCWSMQLFNSYN